MDILLKPIITEKMNSQSESLNRYGFVVDKRATKSQIKNAVKELYDVEIDSVNTMIYGGRIKSRFTKTGVQSGKTKSYKKAIITLKEGEIIDFYSNI
jgi:large subunit ribosomal protein L23